MGTLIVIAGLMFLGAAGLRRVVPICAALIVASAIWKATHDLPTTCAGFVVCLVATAIAMDVAASSSSSLRALVEGLEIAAAGAAAALLAFALLQESQSAFVLSFGTICAALFGGGVVLQRRRLQRSA